jgi:hypothetical protein
MYEQNPECCGDFRHAEIFKKKYTEKCITQITRRLKGDVDYFGKTIFRKYIFVCPKYLFKSEISIKNIDFLKIPTSTFFEGKNFALKRNLLLYFHTKVRNPQHKGCKHGTIILVLGIQSLSKNA